MSKYSLTHLSDGALLRDLSELVARDRCTTALMLAHLAEVDSRKLYLPAAHPSMYAYCVGELRFSEDAAYKRIQAARIARKFPAVFTEVAEGRLHLSAVVLLAAHLTPENAQGLLAAATHRSKAQVEQLLALRFPRPDVPAQVVAIAEGQLAPGQVEVTTPLSLCTPALSGELAPGPVAQPAPAHVERPKVAPLAPERYALQCTVSRSTYEKLQDVIALLGHQVGPHDLPEVIDRALDALKEQLEKRKFARSSKPRPGPRRSNSARHVPAEIKRRVWARDQGQGQALPRNQPARVRPCRSGGPRRRSQRGSHETPLPCAQSIRSRAHVWNAIHESQAR